MKTFYIAVTETLSKVVRIEAEDELDALDKVDSAFAEEFYTLDPVDDFVDRQVEDETDEWESMIEQGFNEKEDFEEVKV